MLRHELISIFAIFAVACGAGHPTDGSRESENRVEPGGDAGVGLDSGYAAADRRWAGFYGGPEEPIELTAGERSFWNEATGNRGNNCSYDSKLMTAAREHASAIFSATKLRDDGDLDRLRFALLKSGVADYSIHLLTAAADKGGLASLLKLIDEQKAGWTHCGVGIAGSESKGRAVWIGVARIVALDPLPTAVSAGSEITVSGRVLVQSGSPIQCFLGYPDGAVARLPEKRLQPDRRFRFNVVFTKAGRNELELVVDAGRGPETAILVPVFVDEPPDPRPVIALDSQGKGAPRPLVEDPAEDLMGYLEAARKRLGLNPLKADERLAQAASAHSRDMARHGFFGHVSPYRGSLAKRLVSEGLVPLRSAENVARSSTAFRIHLNLMRSPSHRVNLLDPEFTHVGIGVAEQNGDLIATEIFARW